jgi:hypothetical protein
MPSQVSMIGAFTDHPVLMPVALSVLYGATLLMFAVLIFWWRMRILRANTAGEILEFEI